MGKTKAQSLRKKPETQVFSSPFDASAIPETDPALQALKAHQEYELHSDNLGQRLHRPKTRGPLSQLGPTQKTPVKLQGLGYHWQHHITNFIFCLIFVGLGFMLSEIRYLVRVQNLAAAGAVDRASSSDVGAHGTYVVESPKLNVRQGPGVRYPVVSELSQGSEIRGRIVDERWLQIGSDQFVYKPSVRKLESFSEPVLARVKVEKAPIRQGPNRDRALLGVYFQGKTVQIHGVEHGWARIGEGQYMPASALENLSDGRLSRRPQLDAVRKTR